MRYLRIHTADRLSYETAHIERMNVPSHSLACVANVGGLLKQQ